MNRLLFFLFIFLLQINYSNALDVDAILITENTEVYFEENGNARLKVYKYFKVNNEEGERIASFREEYDTFSKISNIEINFYNANFNEIKIDKRSILNDHHVNTQDYSYDDERVIYSDFKMDTYPYYMSYSYEIDYKGNLLVPNWSPQISNNLQVNKAKLDVYYHPSIEIKYRSNNIKNESIEKELKGKKHIAFEVDSVSVFNIEPFGPSIYELIPTVLYSPLNFKFDGTSGSTSTWKSIGEWNKLLLDGKDELSEETQVDVKEIVDLSSDTINLIKRLYQYMQDKTRYVSIQFGIGGFQPYSALYVDENGFGDCKALSNYMSSLLKFAGIESNYTIIRAGRNAPPIYTDFPSLQFNHVILNVPLNDDTIWLECTSQEQIFNYLGSFTNDRYGLSIGEEISLVKTPHFGVEKNRSSTKSDLELDEKGNVVAILNIEKEGLEFEDYEYIVNKNKKEQKEWILENIDLNNYIISNFSTNIRESKSPKIELSLELIINSYANVTGSRMFVPVKPIARLERLKTNASIRQNDIIVNASLSIIDSVLIKIPLNYQIEFLPDSLSIESSFGNIESYFHLNGRYLVYYQEVKVFKGRYDPENYEDFKSFYQEVYKIDHKQVVLRKKEL